MRHGVVLIVLGALLCLALPLAYADGPIYDETGNPLFYVFGWGGQWNYTSAGVDIDGEVGHPLTVEGLQHNSRACSTPWTADFEVAEGTLPPGLKLNTDSSISGIPTERGHWIVTMKAFNIENACGRPSTPGFTQQLRFHITGTGKVIAK